MKIILIFLSLFLYADNLTFIQANGYYTNANFSKIYNELLAYEETDKLIEIIDILLKNEKFKKHLYFEEMGKVKVDTNSLLKQLKYFLAGWPKYSNTYFENNTDIAGIKKILKDTIKNDTNFINTPTNVINEMKKSILNLKFFNIANKIQYDLRYKDLHNKENLAVIMKNLSILVNSYVNILSQIKNPLIFQYNKKIKNELEKYYRIYAKANLLKIMKTFSNLINQNCKRVQNGVYF